MESLRFHLLLALVLIAHTVLLSHPAFCDDYSDDNHGNVDEIDLPSTFDEDGFIQGLNGHRQGLKLAPMAKNVQAECLADELPDLQLNDQHCGAATSLVYEKAIPAISGQPFTNYQEVLTKCNINANHITNWMILPVCVPKLDTKLVLSKYTQAPYGTYLKDPKFTGIGVDSIDNWVVVVLSTNTSQGSAAPGGGATSPVSGAGGATSPVSGAGGAIPPTSAAGGATPLGGAASPQGSAATPQGSPSSGAVGIVSEMKLGVYLMTLLLSFGLLLTC